MNSATKMLSPEQLKGWRDTLRQQGQRLVITNGCFDLLHAGHVTYLESARNLGDALLIGLNGDASVRSLKGEGRPLNGEQDRARVLAALECVSAVCVFPEVRATRFLAEAQPDIYVKGGDYTPDTLDQDERRAVESNGGKIVIIPFLPGRSTTNIIRRMASPAC
jgi:rfaE bifunctional protein nucleotidyltransferase chain/domain